MKKRKKKLGRKHLWPIFSKYIRARDKYICCTCGRKGEGSGIHAGHYIPRSKGLALYFDERNVHAQCYDCNIHLGGNGRMYERFMLQKYGKEVITELEQLSKTIMRDSDFNFEQKIQFYEKKLAEILAQ